MKQLWCLLIFFMGMSAQAQVLNTFNWGEYYNGSTIVPFTTVSFIANPNANQTIILNNYSSNGITVTGSLIKVTTDAQNNGTMSVYVNTLLRIRDGTPAIANAQLIQADYIINAGGVGSIGSMSGVFSIPSGYDPSNRGSTTTGSYTSSGQAGTYSVLSNLDQEMYYQEYTRGGQTKSFRLVGNILYFQIGEPSSLLILTTCIGLMAVRAKRRW